MKKRKQPKFVCVEIPQYGAYVVGLLGWTHEECATFLWDKYKIKELTEADGKCLLIKRKNGDIHAIVHSTIFSKDPSVLAVIVHETLHACLLILENIGQGVDTEDHEHLAYMVQHVFQGLITQRASK